MIVKARWRKLQTLEWCRSASKVQMVLLHAGAADVVDVIPAFGTGWSAAAKAEVALRHKERVEQLC